MGGQWRRAVCAGTVAGGAVGALEQHFQYFTVYVRNTQARLPHIHGHVVRNRKCVISRGQRRGAVGAVGVGCGVQAGHASHTGHVAVAGAAVTGAWLARPVTGAWNRRKGN